MSVRPSTLQPLEAVVAGDELRAPQPGFFRLAVSADHLTAAGIVEPSGLFDERRTASIRGRSQPIEVWLTREPAPLPSIPRRASGSL